MGDVLGREQVAELRHVLRDLQVAPAVQPRHCHQPLRVPVVQARRRTPFGGLGLQHGGGGQEDALLRCRHGALLFLQERRSGAVQ